MNLVAPAECQHVIDESLGLGIANSLLALPSNDENGQSKINILIGVHWQPSDPTIKVPFISFHTQDELEFLGLVTNEDNEEIDEDDNNPNPIQA